MGRIRVGISSWTEPTLVKSGWYPSDATTAEDRLRYYASKFPIVEIDSTFYAIPNARTAQLWVERTPKDFTFNAKAYALLTQHPTPVARSHSRSCRLMSSISSLTTARPTTSAGMRARASLIFSPLSSTRSPRAPLVLTIRMQARRLIPAV